MVVWGGIGGANTGGRYNPATDTWLATNTNGAPSGREWHSAVWTGSEMIIWAGSTALLSPQEADTNPSNDTWIATGGSAPSARQFHTAVWTGSEMIVWGGRTGSSYMDTGGRTSIRRHMGCDCRKHRAGCTYNHSAIWTGNEMVVWVWLQSNRSEHRQSL